MSKSSLLINIKSLLLSLFAALFIGTAANAQSLIHLSDATGISISASEEAELQRAADSLIAAFPVAFQDSFKVYDCGFYLQQEHYQGGYPEVFGKLVEEAGAQSKYYLVVGKSKSSEDDEIKYYCNLHFPNTNIFSCMDRISSTRRLEYNNILNMLAKEAKRPIEATQIAIRKTHKIIESLKCCLFDTANSSSCYNCVYDVDYFISFFGQQYFMSTPVLIANDPDWIEPDSISLLPGNSVGNTRTSDFNCTVKKEDSSDSMALDIIIDQMSKETLAHFKDSFGENVEVKFFKFKYPRDCQNFETLWEQYKSSKAKLKLFYGIININNRIGILGTHSTIDE